MHQKLGKSTVNGPTQPLYMARPYPIPHACNIHTNYYSFVPTKRSIEFEQERKNTDIYPRENFKNRTKLSQNCAGSKQQLNRQQSCCICMNNSQSSVI